MTAPPAPGVLVPIVVLSLLIILLFALTPNIPQDLGYHDFADKRTLLGIPNMVDVVSNLAFIVMGIWLWRQLGQLPAAITMIGRAPLALFCLGLILTGLGSGYYHLAPDNDSLVWDRLPMTIAFMSFFSMILNLHLGKDRCQHWLWPLLACGLLSVVYWAYSEAIGAGDLRPYGLVQFLPILLIPLIIWRWPQPAYRARYIVLILGSYLVAKLLEYLDAQMLALIGISGHSLKHLIASLAGVWLLYALRSVRPPDGRRQG